MNYYDRETQRIKTKTIRTADFSGKTSDHFNKSRYSKDEAHEKLINFRKDIPDDNIVDIRLSDYMKLPNNQKRLFSGFKLDRPISWPKQEVPIDPYILGAWLGDGDRYGGGFTTIDVEIVKRYCLWANTI